MLYEMIGIVSPPEHTTPRTPEYEVRLLTALFPSAGPTRQHGRGQRVCALLLTQHERAASTTRPALPLSPLPRGALYAPNLLTSAHKQDRPRRRPAGPPPGRRDPVGRQLGHLRAPAHDIQGAAAPPQRALLLHAVRCLDEDAGCRQEHDEPRPACHPEHERQAGRQQARDAEQVRADQVAELGVVMEGTCMVGVGVGVGVGGSW